MGLNCISVCNLPKKRATPVPAASKAKWVAEKAKDEEEERFSKYAVNCSTVENLTTGSNHK
jgi:hypothetical protein